MTELQEKKINISGIETRYRVTGKSDNKVLIFHGWGGTSYSWRDVSYCLSQKGFEVIALDLPGFGETQPPEDAWDTDDYIKFLLSFVKKLDLKDFYLLGHSFGGALALKFTFKHKELVKKLVLCDPAIIRKERLGIRQKISKFGSKYFSKIIAKTPLYPFFEKAAYWFAGAYDYYHANAIMKEIFQKVISEDMSDIAQKLNKECLIVWGEYDQATPIKDGFVLNQLIKNSQLKVIVDSGHNPHRTHKEELCKVLLKFFES